VSRSPVLSANRQTLVLLAFLLVFPVQVSAADDETSAEPISLAPVVVTPTRLPTPENEVGSSITVIPGEEIERKQERTLSDALQDVGNQYTLVNLAGSYDLGNGVSAYARINNLLDRHYQNPIGFIQPGIGVYAGIRSP
jgi:outer membrane cobalamin receptor